MTHSMCDMCSSIAMVVSAGAMMVETMIRLKPVALRTSVTAHLVRVGQSLGFMGSGAEKVTRNGSDPLADWLGGCGGGI